MDSSLEHYIVAAREAGMSDEEIRAELLNVGWDADMVSTALTQKPVAPAPPHKQSFPMLPLVLLLLAIVGAAGWFGYQLYDKGFQLSSRISSGTPSPSPSPSPATTATFTSSGLIFQYDATWHSKKMADLLENSDTTEHYFLYTAPGFVDTQKKINDFKNNPSADLLAALNLIVDVGRDAEVIVIDLPKSLEAEVSAAPGVTISGTASTQTARDQAKTATQTTCEGDNYTASTDIPVDESRIQSLTVSGRAAFAVASQPNCNAKSYTLFVDTPTGRVITLSFTRTVDQAGMSDGQKVVFNSLKFL